MLIRIFMLEIIQFPDPILLKKSEKVVFPLSKQNQKLVSDMLKLLQSDPEHYAGLSAVQVGVLQRICVCQRYDKKTADGIVEWEVMINPQITSRSEKMVSRWDGCLSVKHGELFAKTLRHDRVTVEFYDTTGKLKRLKAKGFFSHVVQHELDHLDGVLFIKYVKDPSDFYTAEEMNE